MENIFTLKNLIIYLIIINLIGFFAMFIDKRKAQKGEWRISEKTLLTITCMFGGIGTIAGMYIFRHKTQKLRFSIGFPVITLLEYGTLIYLLIK